MALTKTQRRRADDWLRENIVATAGYGHPLDAETLEALPADMRAEVKVLAEHAVSVHASGARGPALEGLRNAVGELDLPADWAPPATERPDKTLVDGIRKGWIF